MNQSASYTERIRRSIPAVLRLIGVALMITPGIPFLPGESLYWLVVGGLVIFASIFIEASVRSEVTR